MKGKKKRERVKKEEREGLSTRTKNKATLRRQLISMPKEKKKPPGKLCKKKAKIVKGTICGICRH